MLNFENYRVEYDNKLCTLIIHIPPNLEEFASELGRADLSKGTSLHKFIRDVIGKRAKDLNIKSVKIMVGSTLITSIVWNGNQANAASNFNMGYLYFGNTNNYITYVDRTKGVINETSPSYFDIYSDGSLDKSKLDPYFIEQMHNRGVKVVPFLSNHWDRNVGRAALANRENLSQQLADTIIKYNLDGINIDIENVTEADRNNYTDLVRLIKEKLPPDKEVSVAVAANPNGWKTGWHGSYDYANLARYADYLMIMAYDESWEGSDPGPVASISFVERSIQYALNQGVPKEKVVLGLPHYGRYWIEGHSYGGTGITNSRINELLSKYENNVIFDSVSKSPKATVIIKDGDPITYINGRALLPGKYTIWFENEESIKAKVDLVDKYNIKGTGNWALGQESPLLWGEFKTWINEPQILVGNVAIAKSNVNFRVSPSLSANILSTAATGDTLQITGETVSSEGYTWYPVQDGNGEKGFVVVDYIKQINVKELYGKSRYDTSAAISKEGWEVTSNVVVLGRGDIPVDALTGSVLAKKVNAPLLLTNTESLPASVNEEIERLKPNKIYLLGGSGAISSNVEQNLINKGYDVERVSGATRYETSVKIAEQINSTEEVILTTGVNSPDPLAVAPYAGMKQIPILLTNKDKLPSEVQDYITKMGTKKVTIIGGEGVVSANVVSQLSDLGVQVDRIAGQDRYETSIKIVERFSADFKNSSVYIASGNSYIDALGGSSLAALESSPIILTNKSSVPTSVKDWLASSNLDTINFLGGYGVIDQEARLEFLRSLQ